MTTTTTERSYTGPSVVVVLMTTCTPRSDMCTITSICYAASLGGEDPNETILEHGREGRRLYQRRVLVTEIYQCDKYLTYLDLFKLIKLHGHLIRHFSHYLCRIPHSTSGLGIPLRYRNRSVTCDKTSPGEARHSIQCGTSQLAVMPSTWPIPSAIRQVQEGDSWTRDQDSIDIHVSLLLDIAGQQCQRSNKDHKQSCHGLAISTGNGVLGP